MTDGLWALTEKEKQTLRLMVRGHDAKSIARSLDLSVHTINERLRDARRKMAVSSSREAARILLQAEGGELEPAHPQIFGDAEIGEDCTRSDGDQQDAPFPGVGRAWRHPRILIGVLLMTLVLGLLALAAVPGANSLPQSPSNSGQAANSEVVDAARQWLALVDQGQWDASYNGTCSAFRKLNSAQVWADASEQARVPLGALRARSLLSQENLPAPPHGYEVVKFQTSYANKAKAVETVSLDHEDDRWCVVGVIIE